MPESAAAADLLYACPMPRSPLADVLQPASLDGAAILTERRGLHVLHVDAGKAAVPKVLAGLTLPLVPNTADMPRGPDGPAALWLGPGRWLLVAPQGFGEEVAAPGLTVVDLSHGRCALRLEGRGARHALATGCLLDLTAEAFPPGQCAQTVVHGLAVTVHSVGDGVVDLYVARSYARALWDRLSGRG
jgi:sarcosine oxidase subunit gamma